MSWQPVTGQSANPFTIVREDGQYTASRGEHVFSDGGEITLPAPEEDSLIAITSLNGNPVDIVGTVDGVVDPEHALDQQKPVYLMSDGQTWFHASKRDVLRIINMVHIETQEANDDETIDFTEVFSDEYERYVIFGDNILGVEDSRSLQAHVSSDGGSSWDSGSTDYAHLHFYIWENGSTSSGGSGGDSKINRIITNAGNSSSNNDTSGFSMKISDPINSNRATIMRNSHSVRLNSAEDSFRAELTGGIRLTQSAIDSIRFFMHSGNIDSGIFSVYGVKS